MKPKIYMLSFDPHKYDADKLHSVIATMPHMHSWWHYLASTYLITSTAEVITLQNYINMNWEGRFLITQMDPYNTGGWLPNDAWAWINEKRR